MPHGDPDPDDPHVLVGVPVVGDSAMVREMAWAFAEEFAALGYDETMILRLFRTPYYAGAHRAYHILGEPEIARIVAEAQEPWAGIRRLAALARSEPRSR